MAIAIVSHSRCCLLQLLPEPMAEISFLSVIYARKLLCFYVGWRRGAVCSFEVRLLLLLLLAVAEKMLTFPFQTWAIPKRSKRARTLNGLQQQQWQRGIPEEISKRMYLTW